MTDSSHISEEELSLYTMRALTRERDAIVQTHLDTCARCRGRIADLAGELSTITVSSAKKSSSARTRENKEEHDASSAVNTEAAPRLLRIPEPEPQPTNKWIIVLPWLITAAVIGLLAYLGEDVRNLRLQAAAGKSEIAQLHEKDARTREVMDVLTSSSTREIAVSEEKVVGEPMAEVIYLKEKAALLFFATNLRPVPKNKTYQLWMERDNGLAPIASGLFRPDGNGSATILLPAIPQGVQAKAFSVTVEPVQGASTPSQSVVLSGQGD